MTKKNKRYVDELIDMIENTINVAIEKKMVFRIDDTDFAADALFNGCHLHIINETNDIATDIYVGYIPNDIFKVYIVYKFDKKKRAKIIKNVRTMIYICELLFSYNDECYIKKYDDVVSMSIKKYNLKNKVKKHGKHKNFKDVE